jgi:hypothetical protein
MAVQCLGILSAGDRTINNMKKTIFFISLLFLPTITGIVKAESSIDDLALFGASLDYSERRGYLDFGGNRIEELNGSSLFTAGVMLGKRWKLSRRLRVQVTVDIKYGSVAGDTLPPSAFRDNNGVASFHSTLLKTSLFHGGCIAELHYPVKVAPDGQWFLLAGAGAHLARIRESETLLDNPDVPVSGDPYVEDDHVTLSASIHGGMGFEIIVSPLFGIAASYSLRYWFPVRYGMSRDLFPDRPVDYRERFLSHEFNVLILVKR